jgi:hypothetical protein
MPALMAVNDNPPLIASGPGATLLCATCSPFWWHHLTEWLPSLKSGGAAAAPNTKTVLEGSVRFELNGRGLPVNAVAMLDILHAEAVEFDNQIASAGAIAVFLQGSKLKAATAFLQRIASLSEGGVPPPPLLLMASLSDAEDIARLSDTCGELGLDAQIANVSAMDDELTLSTLTRFLAVKAPQKPGHAPRLAVVNEATQAELIERNYDMASIADSLNEVMKADGAIAAALVDSTSGMVLGKVGNGINLDAAGAGNTEVVRAKIKTMKSLGLNDTIEDILISLGTQYHIIRPIASKPGIFFYLVLTREKANLGMARYKVMEVEKSLAF